MLIVLALVVLAGLGLAFYLGQAKNASKLAAVKVEVSKIEAAAVKVEGVVVADYQKAVASIKAIL